MLIPVRREESHALREFLRESGYTIQALAAITGGESAAEMRTKVGWAKASLGAGRLNTLVRWFWLDSAVDVVEARGDIPDAVLDCFLRSGMLANEEGRFVPRVRISPFNQLFLLSDHVAASKAAQAADTVLWPNPTTRLASRMAMRNRVERTLDLGTGCGVLAILAAAHSGHVVATDLNPRTRDFCEFNASLNGVENVEFREGSGFEPVRGERFDLILTNPPFFVTPKVRRVLSDSGRELDGFCRALVQESPAHLNEGGYCQMLAEWVQVKGQGWQERIGGWMAETGCDAWVIANYARSSVEYALSRMNEDEDFVPGSEEQVGRLRSWVEYFDARQVESIYGGMIVLRKRAGGVNWVRMEEVMTSFARPFGEALRQGFAVRDGMEGCTDADLLRMLPLIGDGVRVQQESEVTSEGFRVRSMLLKVMEGIPYSMPVQPQIAELMALCDGKRTIAEIIEETAASMSMPAVLVEKAFCDLFRRFFDWGIAVLRA